MDNPNKNKEIVNYTTIPMNNIEPSGSFNYPYSIKVNGIPFFDNNKEKISYWLNKIEYYTGSETIQDVASNEIVAVRPMQEMVWFNIVGESLQRTLELNLNNTNNKKYVIYRFTSNIINQDYGYKVRNTNGSQLFYAGTFGLKLETITYENSNHSLPLTNYAYIFNHLGTYPVEISVINKKVQEIATYNTPNCGIIGFYNRGLCISDFKKNYEFDVNGKLKHGYSIYWGDYWGLICPIPEN